MARIQVHQFFAQAKEILKQAQEIAGKISIETFVNYYKICLINITIRVLST